MEKQIYRDQVAFAAACCVYNVTPTVVTYEGQEVNGALVRDDNGKVIIMIVCDQAAWSEAEFKNRY